MSEIPYLETGYSDLNPVEEAVSQRRSLRGFTDQPVPMDLIKRILVMAARAPSGTNMQPWLAHVVTGDKLEALKAGLLKASNDPDIKNDSEFPYYPPQFFEPYKGRRRKVGWDLYGILGIEKGDFEKTKAQHDRNLIFFDAPVGMIFTIDKRLEIGSWLDYGMYLQNIMTVARQYGLHTCPQAAWPSYHTIIKRILDIPDSETVVCGMALGYEDTSLPENALRTDRAALDDHITFHED